MKFIQKMRKFAVLLLGFVSTIALLRTALANDFPPSFRPYASGGTHVGISTGANTALIPVLFRNYPCVSNNPGWKILVLVYETTNFYYTDEVGTAHHFYGVLTQAEIDKINIQSNRFVLEDIPALNNCNMRPTITIRYPEEALSNLTETPCSDYAPWPDDVADDRDPNFDSVITIWDGSGIDLITGEDLSIQGCAYAWHMGTGQTYGAIFADFVTIYNSNSRNVFKHEWGHSILFYYDAAGTAPDPPVDNHINNTTNQYVNCLTGQPYILIDETDDNPIPNSIFNNYSGFTHDYYSGFTATADQPARCVGITAEAWASGGPITRPLTNPAGEELQWRGPDDDVVLGIVHFSW
jgi:hypothetical protein